MLMQIFKNTFPSNKYYIFLISFTILFSCNSFQGTSISKNSLEILIVSNENCKQLEEFKNHFFLPQKAITESELTGNLYNVFDLTYIEYTDFTEYFHGYQNIVFLSSGSNYSISEKKQKWHKLQTVLDFTIDSLTNEKELRLMSSKLINQIKEKELYRRINKNKNRAKKEISQFIQREFMLNISLSNNYSIVDTASGFIDIRRDFENSIHRIILSKSQRETKISKNNVIKEINKISKNNIFSETQGAFANIDDINANVYIESLPDKTNIIELRALWKMYNDPAPMGGPMLAYVINDKKIKQSIIFIYYIFAPGEDKAEHLIEAEAVGKSLFY